jgi:hypothetical protein
MRYLTEIKKKTNKKKTKKKEKKTKKTCHWSQTLTRVSDLDAVGGLSTNMRPL